MAKPPTPAQQAAAIVHAQYVPIDYALAQQRKSDARAQAALQAAGHALIAQLQGGVKPAGQAYDQAIGQQQALAQGGASLLANLNPNAHIQQDLAAINAPPEQRAQLAQQTQAQFPGQGAVLNIEQGTIPGASLVAQKAAAQQFLAGLPALAGLSQQRSAQGLAAQAAQNRQALYGQRLSAAAQIPQIAQTIQAAEVNRQFQADQAAASRAYESEQVAINRQFQAAQAQLGRQLTPYEKAQIAHQERADRLAQQQSQLVQQTGGLTPYQSMSLAERKREFNLRQGKTTGSGTTGLSPTAARSARAKGNVLLAHVREARAGFLSKKTNPSTGEIIFTKPPTYNEAVRLAEQQGIPLDIAVPMLNRVFPVQYEVTDQGLKQIGIRGYPSTFQKTPGSKRKRK